MQGLDGGRGRERRRNEEDKKKSENKREVMHGAQKEKSRGQQENEGVCLKGKVKERDIGLDLLRKPNHSLWQKQGSISAAPVRVFPPL